MSSFIKIGLLVPRKKILKSFVIYGHDGHVSRIIYKDADSSFIWMIHVKFGFDWPWSFRGEDL